MSDPQSADRSKTPCRVLGFTLLTVALTCPLTKGQSPKPCTALPLPSPLAQAAYEVSVAHIKEENQRAYEVAQAEYIQMVDTIKMRNAARVGRGEGQGW